MRRAALGVVRIILENGLKLSLHAIFDRITLLSVDFFVSENESVEGIGLPIFNELTPIQTDKILQKHPDITIGELHDLYESQLDILRLHKDLSRTPNILSDNCFVYVDKSNHWDGHRNQEFKISDLQAFIADRLKVYLRDKGIRHDLIDAVFALGEDDLVAIVNRVEALQSFLVTSEGENLLAGYKRAANILKAEAKKGELPTGEIGTLSQAEAVALQTGLTNSKTKIETALASESYSTAMTALSELRIPIDDFFDNVMVVSEDEETRKNNLSLLMLIRDTARQIADFDKISG